MFSWFAKIVLKTREYWQHLLQRQNCLKNNTKVQLKKAYIKAEKLPFF